MGGGERAVFSQSCENVTVRYNGGGGGGGDELSLASPVGMSR